MSTTTTSNNPQGRLPVQQGSVHPVHLNGYPNTHLPHRLTVPGHPGVVYEYVPAPYGTDPAGAHSYPQVVVHPADVAVAKTYGTTPGGGTGPDAYSAPWEREVRLRFIRKVFALLSVMLGVCFGGTLACLMIAPIREYIQRTPGLIWLALIGMLSLACCMACFEGARRTYPTNYILLGLYTIFSTYVVAVLSSFYDTAIIVFAIGLTLAVTAALTVFALQTKYDFTTKGGILFAAFWIFILFTMLQVWFFNDYFMTTVLSAIGALLFSAYIVYDVQLLVGGQHKKVTISEDEYVFAALTIFTDIINLYMFILALLSGGRQEGD